MTLTGVWHVPKIRGNLMSVSRMVDAGYTIEFGPTSCTIRKAGIRTKIGERSGRLYHLITELAKPQLGGTVYATIGLT